MVKTLPTFCFQTFLLIFIYFIYLFTSFSGHRPAQRDVHERDSGPMRGAIPTQSHNQ